MGSVETNLQELMSKPNGLQIKRKSRKRRNKTYGELNVDHYSEISLASFLDYLQGDVDMSLMTGIDFTGSNGHPSDLQSLHNLTAGKPSDYQLAIRQIGNILSVYDTDKKYPVWGFGANFQNVSINKEYYNGTKHDFALNFNSNNPEVAGMIQYIYFVITFNFICIL